jgi:AcrR family transcriptional regulator
VSETRRYSTALRAEQTALSRRRILDVAARLFVERGYHGTTLAGVAELSGVSVQTIYNVVGGKPALFKATYDAMVIGDDPEPMGQWPVVKAMAVAADGQEYLARYAELTCELLQRVLPLTGTLFAHATLGDQELRAVVDTVEAERIHSSRRTARRIARGYGLRDGLDAATAADLLWTFTGPELADRLVNQRGWDWPRYQRWLGVTMADALLGPQ